ncbi:hypothetical protein [Xanthobacter sp.]|uniref:hypothetical protein n=1 Tax=Xanthobacter sp. TaxID=35809 RepID=UPI0025E80449|nr:hypothetical protein [Xanthobacter sp.]
MVKEVLKGRLRTELRREPGKPVLAAPAAQGAADPHEDIGIIRQPVRHFSNWDQNKNIVKFLIAKVPVSSDENMIPSPHDGKLQMSDVNKLVAAILTAGRQKPTQSMDDCASEYEAWLQYLAKSEQLQKEAGAPEEEDDFVKSINDELARNKMARTNPDGQ